LCSKSLGGLIVPGRGLGALSFSDLLVATGLVDTRADAESRPAREPPQRPGSRRER
jgi:hypothetical protein